MRHVSRQARRLAALATAMALAGCGRGQVARIESLSDAQILDLYSPKRIEILPFTKVKSFNDDLIPDGIEVALRPIDTLGDPIKAYGEFRFELYTYRPASGERAGEQLETWVQPIVSEKDQAKFWDRATSTYTFQLTWEGGEFPAVDRKYILLATFQGSGEKRLTAEYVLPPPSMDRDAIRGDMTRSAGGNPQ